MKPRYDRDNNQWFCEDCLKTTTKDINGNIVHADTFERECGEK